MINRQFSYDSYYPSMMPFFSTEGSNHQEEIWPLESNSQFSVSTPYESTTSYQPKLQFMPVISNPPSLATSNSFNLYPTETQPTHELYTGFLKPVQERIGYDGLPIGLNLSQQSYFSPCQRRNFDYMYWRSRDYLYGHPRPRCQEEGCKADLSNAKRYHRRHKVCEFHSKASVVIVSGGLQQRFCQQCSRFHSLDEFDEAKKSCRKRLADHNRRRRKPQSPSSTSTKTVTNVATKKKQTPSSSKAAKCRTSTTTVTHGDGKSSEGKNDCSIKPASLKTGPSAVEMGCTGSRDQLNHLEVFDLFSNDCLIHQHPILSCSSNIFFNQQNLPCSSSIGTLQTIEDDYELSHQHDHNLQVGQVMFGMEFL